MFANLVNQLYVHNIFTFYIYELYLWIVFIDCMGYQSLFSILSYFRTTLKKVHLVIQQINWMIFLQDSFLYWVNWLYSSVKQLFIICSFYYLLFIGYYLTAYTIRFDNFQ
jgi:hypothetical protein